MNQEQNNFNVNNFNTQGNNGMPNNQPLNSNQVVGYDPQTGQPIYSNQNNQFNSNIQKLNVNKNKKKKKYWLIPVLVFIAMVVFPVISNTLRIVGINISIISTISTLIYVICGLAFIPSIIVAIVLSNKNK